MRLFFASLKFPSLHLYPTTLLVSYTHLQAFAIVHIFKVDHLKYEHEKLQKKSNKQTTHIEKERDQVGFKNGSKHILF